MKKKHEEINELLVHLFNEIMTLEERAIVDRKHEDVSNTELHVLDAVGLEGGNMTAIAAKLRITVGSLTTSMNRLAAKGYVERIRSEEDRRVVNVRLTENGIRAYEKHRRFHMCMVEAALKDVEDDQADILLNMLVNLKKFFYQYERAKFK